jgi:hypothetical protein
MDSQVSLLPRITLILQLLSSDTRNLLFCQSGKTRVLGPTEIPIDQRTIKLALVTREPRPRDERLRLITTDTRERGSRDQLATVTWALKVVMLLIP